MQYKKDNFREAIFIEIAAWAFILGVVYLFTKVVF